MGPALFGDLYLPALYLSAHIRQHTTAYVSICSPVLDRAVYIQRTYGSIRQHMSAYVYLFLPALYTAAHKCDLGDLLTYAAVYCRMPTYADICDVC